MGIPTLTTDSGRSVNAFLQGLPASTGRLQLYGHAVDADSIEQLAFPTVDLLGDELHWPFGARTAYHGIGLPLGLANYR